MEGTTPRASLAAMTASVSLVALVALLGASAATPPTGASPPFSLDAHPGPWLVTALLAAAVLLGAAGVHGAWRSARRGWTPSIRRLLAASALTVGVLVLLPPIGSADPQSYAAYGQMVVVGHDPYVTTPAQLGGPYGNTVEAPWRDTPSIYGPIATAEQSLAAHIAGPHHPGGPCSCSTSSAASPSSPSGGCFSASLATVQDESAPPCCGRSTPCC